MNITLSQDLINDIVNPSHDSIIRLIKIGNEIEKYYSKYLQKNTQYNDESRGLTDVSDRLSQVQNDISQLRLLVGGGTKKGKIAEFNVQMAIQNFFPHAEITNDSMRAACGDLVVIIDGCTIMIEVKNYNKAVPSKEIDKFHKDIENNPKYDAAIIVSCNAGIARIENNFSLVIKNKTVIIYLSRVAANDIMLQCAILLAQTLVKMLNSETDQLIMESKKNLLVGHINKMLGDITQSKREKTTFINNITKEVNSYNSKFNISIEQQKDHLLAMLKLFSVQ